MDATIASAKVTELPELKSPVVIAIERARVAKSVSYEGQRLAISALGRECERQLFYAFRWVAPLEQFDGRKLRLFATGNVEEQRLIDDLLLAGVYVEATDPHTGGQWEILLAGGHLRGKADGRLRNLPGAELTEHLLECKSHNDKSFKALKKEGVEKSKPEHYAQCQLGMHGLSLTRALYLAVNKNDDELYAERIKYDADAALRLVAKAERIVATNDAPPKLHEDPDAKMAWLCRSCPAVGVCHHGEFARRNCRTCMFSTAVAGGGWICERFNKPLNIAEQRAGCDSHRYLPTLVAGEQVDATPDLTEIVYAKPDGSEWRDGVRP